MHTCGQKQQINHKNTFISLLGLPQLRNYIVQNPDNSALPFLLLFDQRKKHADSFALSFCTSRIADC